MPTPPLKIQFSLLKSTYAHWVTDCEYCPWTKPQPSRPAGSYANGEEQWSAFTVGLIYELDLLRLFIEWVTAYATSSCVNSCVQGEGKKKKKRTAKDPNFGTPLHVQIQYLKIQYETGSTCCFVPRRKEARMGTAVERETLSQGILSTAWHCSLPRGSSATGDAPGSCPTPLVLRCLPGSRDTAWGAGAVCTKTVWDCSRIKK